jgi:hypothetical protein
MDFHERLERAIQRGERTGEKQRQADATQALSKEEFKRLHSKYRLELSEHIEACVAQLPNHLPGFQFETVVSDRGWGAAASRDDIGRGGAGRRDNFYSRLEMVVRPLGKYHVLDLAAKGAVRNKEIFNRNHFQQLDEIDLESFRELIDLWVLEYAELYAAKN